MKRQAAAFGTLLILFAVTVGSGESRAEPGPSAQDVAGGRDRVADKAAELGKVKSRLAQAAADLDRYSTAAEVAVERYNGATVRLAAATKAYTDVQGRVAQADAAYQATRREVAMWASQAYRLSTGMDVVPLATSGQGGAQGFIDRATALQMLADKQAGAVQRAKAAETVADLVRRQAARLLQARQDAAAEAASAKAAAAADVARQTRAVHAIQAEQAKLGRELAQARATAADIVRRHAEAQGNHGSAGRSTVGLFQGSARGSIAVRAALRWLGTPYSWGGGNSAGPTYGIAQGAGIKGFDCSGLMLYAWSQAGVRLDHWTGTQWTSGPHVPTDLLRPGDLVFFATDTRDPDTIHHVGMFIGRGQMIEAPYTGAQVRISSVWRHDLIGATRPIG